MNFKNVETNYLDGKPNGVRRCRIMGSVIEAIIIPREALNDAKSLANESSKQGIYFLIEDKEPGFPSTHNEECHCGGMTSNAA